MRYAGEKEKKVLVLALMSALLSVGDSLINLYVTPSVLAVVERRAPFGELVLTILVFAGLLMLFAAGASYVGTNSLYGRVQVRSAIITALNRKAATTSFPNVGDEKAVRKGKRGNLRQQRSHRGSLEHLDESDQKYAGLHYLRAAAVLSGSSAAVGDCSHYSGRICD